jgi:hypothetical protein
MDKPSPIDRLSDPGIAARLSPELLLCLEEVWESIDVLPLAQVVNTHGKGTEDLVIAVYKILTRHGGGGEGKGAESESAASYRRRVHMLVRTCDASVTAEGGWYHFKRIGKEGDWVGATTWRIYAHAKDETCALQLASFILANIMFAKGMSLTSFKLPLLPESVYTRADNCVLYFSTRSSMEQALKVLHELDSAIFEDSLPRLVTREGTGYGFGQEPAMISVDFEACLSTGNTVGVGEVLKFRQVGQQSFNKLRAELILLALINVKARSQSRRGGGGTFDGFVNKVLALFKECGLDTIDTGKGRGPGSGVTIGSGRHTIHVLRLHGG